MELKRLNCLFLISMFMNNSPRLLLKIINVFSLLMLILL